MHFVCHLASCHCFVGYNSIYQIYNYIDIKCNFVTLIYSIDSPINTTQAQTVWGLHMNMIKWAHSRSPNYMFQPYHCSSFKELEVLASSSKFICWQNTLRVTEIQITAVICCACECFNLHVQGKMDTPSPHIRKKTNVELLIGR